MRRRLACHPTRRAMLVVGALFGLGLRPALARACSDYGATLVRDNPTQFYLLAALPLPGGD